MHISPADTTRAGLPRQADRGRGQHEQPDGECDGDLQGRQGGPAGEHLHQVSGACERPYIGDL